MTTGKRRSSLSRMSEAVGLAVANMSAKERAELSQPSTATIIEVDPKLCRMNRLHRRQPLSANDETLIALSEQMRVAGQVTPVRGWLSPDPSDGSVGYELVFGARRRAAAEMARMPLMLELIQEPSDAELIAMMYGENSNRSDYSPFEKGMEFQAYLSTGAARTHDSLAELLGESKSTVTRCLQVAGLPAEVVAAFGSPRLIPMVGGAKLSSLIANSEAMARVLQAATRWTPGGGDPLPAFLRAAAGRPEPGSSEVALTLGKTTFGTVRGGDSSGPMVVQLRRDAPPEIKAEILEVIRRHFPGFKP